MGDLLDLRRASIRPSRRRTWPLVIPDKAIFEEPNIDMAMNFNKGPFGGHHLGGDSCPPITFEVVPY